MTRLSDEEFARRRAALDAGREEGLPLAEIARRLGLSINTFQRWATSGSGSLPDSARRPAPSPMAEPLSPAERHDAAFWRARAKEAERRAIEAERLAESLSGVRALPVDPPRWLASPGGGHGRAIIIAHTSDLHMGEVIAEGEVSGLNRFDPEICRARMRRYFEAVCTLGPRWLADSDCDGLLLTLGGDLTSGDIHEELMRTNGLTTTEQVAAAVELYEAGLRMALEAYPRVHVAAVPGNHGRLTAKPTAKLAARLSYDMMVASILRDRFRGEARATWSMAEGADVRLPVYGRTIMVTHGDRIGTGGGTGFAGPVLPIVRGAHKVRLQAHSAGLGCDLILMGHYHTSAAPPGVLANGSVPGYSEYGNGLRAAVEPPKQWLARYSLRWGLCEHLAVQLEAPVKAKARFRVPAEMG